MQTEAKMNKLTIGKRKNNTVNHFGFLAILHIKMKLTTGIQASQPSLANKKPQLKDIKRDEYNWVYK